MKTIGKRMLAGLFVIGMGILADPVQAALKTTGSGDAMAIDQSGFPPDMAENYKVMEAKCKKCHTMERTVVAIQTGLGPVSGNIFDKDSTAAYGVKMLRMPDSGMSKEEVKKVVDLLNFLIDLAAK